MEDCFHFDLHNKAISIQSILKGGIIDKSSPVVGGTALNAAKAFREKKFEPIIFGKIGDDNDGRLLIKELKENNINALIAISKEKPTGCCHLIFLENMPRTIIQEIDNANDYDLNNLAKALNLTKIERKDIIFLAGHPLVRQGVEHARNLMSIIAKMGAQVILDIVPHNMSEKITFDEFKAVVRNNVHVIIAEYQALRGFVNYPDPGAATFPHNIEEVVKIFNSEIGSKILVVRYGEGNIEKQAIWKADRDSNQLTILEPEQDTGYTRIPIEERRGFGDKLTAELLSKYYKALAD